MKNGTEKRRIILPKEVIEVEGLHEGDYVEGNKEKWSKFSTIRIVEGRPRKVIVDIYGNIINNNPTYEELKKIKRHPDTGSREIFKLQEEERKIYLLEFLRYFYYKEGRAPLLIEFDSNKKYPSPKVYMKVFGSWNHAIREAMLQPRWGGKNAKIFTDEELLKFLIQFYEENGRSPTREYFINDPKYPGFWKYVRCFGNWQKALKIVGLDIDSMVRRGVIETNDQKARLGEVFILDHFEEIGSIDLSGENKNSPCDGVCPKGFNYDVKTSAYFGGWHFKVKNVNKDKIEWFYLLAFNEDYTKLLFAWRIPALDLMEDIKKGFIHIGLNKNYANNLENLKEYEIAKKIKHIFEKWQNNMRKWTKEETLADVRMRLKIYMNQKSLI